MSTTSTTTSTDTEDEQFEPLNEEVRSALKSRIEAYQRLLLEYQTPLFHNEVVDAIKLHEKILQHPEPTPAERHRVLDQIRVLDKIHGRLDKHWSELHKDMNFWLTLITNIDNYEHCLIAWIFLDYTPKYGGKAYKWPASIVESIDNIHNGTGKVDEDFRIYQRAFARPVKEMMLDPDNVERRLRIAATGSTHPTGEIDRFIDECDWHSLAAALLSDRELVAAIFDARHLNPDHKLWKSPTFGPSVLQKINSVRDRYFTRLSAPTSYALSKRARELTAKKAARAAARRASTSPTPQSQGSDGQAEEPSAVTAAKNAYKKLVGVGLGRAGASLRAIVRRGPSMTTPGATLDSTTQLIDTKEKGG